MQFVVKKILRTTREELDNIGFDTGYISKGCEKHNFLSLKIFNLKPQQASILKQTALSLGTDCAVHRHVIDCRAELSDAILSGSIGELHRIADKLRSQPFSLSKLAEEIERQIKIFSKDLSLPKIMGILNLTEDSFSDGGECVELKDALNKADLLIEEGAQIIDIGAESTRPNAKPVDPERETELILPVVKALKEKYPSTELSVDTRNASTAQRVIDAGADIINDVSGFEWDEEIINVVLRSNAKYVLMHSRGTPETMDEHCKYGNVADEVYKELGAKLEMLLNKGYKLENIIIDPGFGFAKNPEQNLKLLKHIEEFKSFGCELLVGTSRKRFLAPFTLDENPKCRDGATAITSFYAALKGVDIIRVHNAAQTKSAIDLAYSLL